MGTATFQRNLIGAMLCLAFQVSPLAAEVMRTSDFFRVISEDKKIAVAPAVCSIAGDCANAAVALVSGLRERFREVIVMSLVARAMMDAGIEDLSVSERREAIMATLGADMLAIVEVKDLANKVYPLVRPFSARVELVIYAAGRETPIAKGATTSDGASSGGAIGGATQKLIREVFPKVSVRPR